MKKIPNELSKFMYQLDNGNKAYRDNFKYNNFILDNEDAPVVKLGHTTKRHHIPLNPELSNGDDQSELIGRGCDIVNALCYGFRTDEDIAHHLFISRRTADRLFNKSSTSRKPNFQHIIWLVNIKDNIFYHYHYDRSNNHYQLKTNNVFGRWRAKKVVDNVTFTHFEWIIHSPLIKQLKHKYRFSTPLQMIHQIFKQGQRLQIIKLKNQIIVQLANKYNNDTFNMLFNINNYYANRITSIELHFHNFTDFPVLSRNLVSSATGYFNYLIQKQYSNSATEWEKAMKYKVSDALMYAYLFQKLAKRYKDYKHIYYSDKYHLMTKAKWNILRFINYQHFI